MHWLIDLLNKIRCDELKTAYSHENKVYTQNDVSFLELDCSGLAELWLRNARPQALAEVYDYIRRIRDTDKYQIVRLYSFDFYDFFNSESIITSSQWQKVDIKQELHCGDILAFINPLKKGRWGHVAIVEQEISRSSTKIVIRVIDSSLKPHFDDWRQSDKMGIGQGTIELILDQGEIKEVCYGAECREIRKVCAARLKDKI